MHSYYYDLNKIIQTSNSSDEENIFDENVDKTLSKISYKPLELDIDQQNILGEPIKGNLKEMIKKYSCLIVILNKIKLNMQQPIIQLPNLCLMSIDDKRFNFDDKTKLITMINRSKYESDSEIDDKNFINDFTQTELTTVDSLLEIIRNKKLLYLSGMKGIGKSFMVYQMVAKLMTDTDNYRVIYIHQVDASIIKNTLKILKVITYYDFLDEQTNKFTNNFQSWLNKLDKNVSDFLKFSISCDDYAIANDIISNLSEYYANNFKDKIELIFIYDQINEIIGKKHIYGKQYLFLRGIINDYRTVVSASANNEEENLNVLEGSQLTTLPVSFNLKQFLIYRSFNSNALKYVQTEAEAKQVLSVTGGVPYELSRFFCPKAADSLNDLMIKYANDFIRPNSKERFSNSTVIKWLVDLKNQDEKDVAIDNIARTILGSNIKFLNDRYDKRIFSLIEIDNLYYLKPFSCFAMNSILLNYGKYLNNPLNKEFEAIMNSNSGYSNSTFGNFVEVFIIQSLCIKSLCNPKFIIQFPVHVYSKNQLEFLQMNDYELIYFAGLTTPPTQKFINPFKNKLYRPLASNYPGYDFFYFDSVNNNFYLIQITNQENPLDHVLKNDNKILTIKSDNKSYEYHPKSYLSKAINEWIKYLPTKPNFIEIWILNKRYLQKFKKSVEIESNLDFDNKQLIYRERKLERLNHMNIIYFDEMELMPELAKYFKI